MKIIFETPEFRFSKEDSGQALIGQLDDQLGGVPGEENGLFVRIQSWDETKEHKEFNVLKGKWVRVTIEVVE